MAPPEAVHLRQPAHPIPDEHLQAAHTWAMERFREQALPKADCLAEDFWLRDPLEAFGDLPGIMELLPKRWGART